jgi:hypothetical protein
MTVRQTFLAISAIALLGTSAAQAEIYQGVLVAPRDRDRADVMHDAMRTARAPGQNASAGSRANSRVVSTPPQLLDVRAERRAGGSL